MDVMIQLALAILPAALLWLYIWKLDTRPEPAGQLLRAVFYGICICVPVALLEVVIEQMLFGGEPTTVIGTTIQAFWVAAIPEESMKLLALWLVLRHNPYFDEHFDGIVYAVCVGLGFAAVENIFYVFSQEEWLSVAISRALLAVPGHYAFAILMGYYYSVYHFVDHSSRTATCILLVPVLAHGIYDAIALSTAIIPAVGGITFTLLIFFCVRVHKFARKKMLAQIDRDAHSEMNA